MTLEAGRELLHYHLVEQIGKGGMGVVWKASDTRLDRTVAIKVLPAHLSEDETLRARFEREARAISQLNHPHICTLHDIGRDDGVDFIVMEFLDGQPLMGLDDWASIPPVSAALAAMEKDWVFFTEAISQMVVGWGRPGSMPIAERFRTVTTRDELRSMYDAFVELNLESFYPEITARTLLEHNPGYFFPATYSRRIASLIPDCTMVVFKGASETFLADYSAAREFLGEGDG